MCNRHFLRQLMVLLIFSVVFFCFLLIPVSAEAGYLTYGDTVKSSDGSYTLTPPEKWRGGSLWLKDSIPTEKGLTATFDYKVTDGESSPLGYADGLVLSISREPGLGSYGEGLGFIGYGAYGIEFDSYVNKYYDPDGAHLAIIKDSVSNHISYKMSSLAVNGTWTKAKVTYKNKKLTVYINGIKQLSCNTEKLPKDVYIGISASTGDGFARHAVRKLVVTGVDKKNNKTIGSTEEVCHVVFDPNGGKSTATQRDVLKGKKFGKLPVPSRKGFVFTGWYNRKSGGTKITASHKVNKDITLFAHWKAKQYTVKYEKNGGKGAFNSQKKTYGKALTLHSGKPTRKGYTFQGWSTKKNSKVVYKAGAKYKKNSNATLYAKWKKSSNKNKSTKKANPKKSPYNVQVKFRDVASKKIVSLSVPYSDNYFDGNSKKVHEKLAKLSAVAASSAYSKEYAKDLLERCGFKGKKGAVERYTNEVTRKDNDHGSFTIGHKKSGGKYIVAILVKGTSGNYEWVSNFNVGTGGHHKGFSIAEKEILKQVYQYMEKYQIPKSRSVFWITGHSRGAAIGNLLAKDLTDNSKIGAGSVFAYTFATPRVSTKAKNKGYENIKNYLNPGDWVTDVAPKKWGYGRYGVDKMMSSNKSGMKKIFRQYTGMEYGGFGKEGKESLTNAFLLYTPTLNTYNKGRVCVKTSGGPGYCYPKDFCQYGLGYLLAKEARCYAMIVKSAADCTECSVVTGKLITDGKINNKFYHSHTTATYVAWLNAMYN